MKISLSEIEFINISNADYGKLFFWQNRLFRGIYKENANTVREIFDSGLMEELIERKYFIKTLISDLDFETFELVLEHEIIKTIIYPREWTFSMLKEAALLILNINEVAKKYKFKTIDCHVYNVLFKNSNPIYVDFGSFKKSNFSDSVLAPYHEFMISYIYPLRVFAFIGQYFGRYSVPESIASNFIPVDEYIKIFYPALRRFNNNFLVKFIYFVHILRTLHYRDLTKINKRFIKEILYFILKTQIYKLGSGPAKIVRLRKYINHIKQKSNNSYWSNYQYQLPESQEKSLINGENRFSIIEKKLLLLNVKTITEIAGNQGVFSILIHKHGFDKIICIDADSYALDIGYLSSQKKCLNIEWATLNPFANNYSILEKPPHIRLRSEVVLALALTHHLILSQYISISKVIEIFALYTTKYIFLEFMPLGLHNGISAPPLPDWYNIENFSLEFSKFFKIIEICNLEKNRTLFIGEKL